VSTADIDEFAAYDFSEFTAEDFAQIDAEIIKIQLPKTTIEYEVPSPPPDSKSEPEEKPRGSPLDLFRHYGNLSVSDLVSLSWYLTTFVSHL
jgi:exonuclease V